MKVKNVKIGHHMAKLWTTVWWQTFFDSQCSIQALVKLRQSYNYTLQNSVMNVLRRKYFLELLSNKRT